MYMSKFNCKALAAFLFVQLLIIGADASAVEFYPITFPGALEDSNDTLWNDSTTVEIESGMDRWVQSQFPDWDKSIPLELSIKLNANSASSIHAFHIASGAVGNSSDTHIDHQNVTVTWPTSDKAVLYDPLNEVVDYISGAQIASGSTIEVASNVVAKYSRWFLTIPLNDISDQLVISYRSDVISEHPDGLPVVAFRVTYRGADGDEAHTSDIADADEDGIPDTIEGNRDTDTDGVPNDLDTDSDNDGTPDAIEYLTDSDNDGAPDYIDLDSDNDGINDQQEGRIDTDSDGFPDSVDSDSDNDGVSDGEEKSVDSDGDGLMDYRDPDSDNDGIPDEIEGSGDTDDDGEDDRVDKDSDGDGIPDAVESVDAQAPIDSDGDLVSDYKDTDSDNDGIPDAIEAGGNPESPNDANANGVPDYQEENVDTDNDYLPDYLEGHTDTDSDGVLDFMDLDSDDDGIPDKVEAIQNGDVGVDTDGDGILDFQDKDSDNDGISDREESSVDTDGDAVANFRDTDSDNDGILDSIESGYFLPLIGLTVVINSESELGNGLVTGANESGTIVVDTDGDGLPNYIDLDSDNDGLPDTVEANKVDDNLNGIVDIAEDRTDAAIGSDLGQGSSAGVVDTDGDLVPDYIDLDSDNDGLWDIIECYGAAFDVNVDGVVDGFSDKDFNGLDDEFQTGELTPKDTDGDGKVDAVDLDSDADGIADLVETSDMVSDAEGEIKEFVDNDVNGSDDSISLIRVVVTDSDNDGTPDFQDTDADNDGVSDFVETGALDDDGDGVADFLIPADELPDIDRNDIPDFQDAATQYIYIKDTTTVTVLGSNTPDANTPDANTPNANTPDANTPNANTPDANTPDANTPDANTPDANTPDANTPDANTPDANTPGANTPDANTPDANTPDANTPGSNTPGSNTGSTTPSSALEESVTVYTAVRGSGCSVHSEGGGNVTLLLLGFFACFILIKRFLQRHYCRILIAVFVGLLVYPVSTIQASEPNKPLNFAEDSATRDSHHIYATGGIGGSQLRPDTSEDPTLIHDGKVKLAGQLALGVELFDLLSVELHAASLSRARFASSGSIGYRQVGSSLLLNVSNLVDHPFRKNLFVYGRVGVGKFRNDSSEIISHQQKNNWHGLFGVGLEYRLNDVLGLRTDLISFDRDAQLAQLGLLYRFGVKERVRPNLAHALPEPMVDVDEDGVRDEIDECDTTNYNIAVNEIGCAFFDGVVEDVHFHFDSARLTPLAMSILDSVIATLMQHTKVNLEIFAHTDAIASEQYNMSLSKRRALSVARYLSEGGVSVSRLRAKGYGETQPVSTNKTDEGRQRNRRVEMQSVLFLR